MKKIKILGLTLVIIVLMAGYALAESGSLKSEPQKNCPVMEGKIHKEIYVDYEGKRGKL